VGSATETRAACNPSRVPLGGCWSSCGSFSGYGKVIDERYQTAVDEVNQLVSAGSELSEPFATREMLALVRLLMA